MSINRQVYKDIEETPLRNGSIELQFLAPALSGSSAMGMFSALLSSRFVDRV
ncbi:MAG: hypothetical protein ACI9FN_001370 [Saprospiraceae bacterium]|jgi:hypothetical protein